MDEHHDHEPARDDLSSLNEAMDEMMEAQAADTFQKVIQQGEARGLMNELLNNGIHVFFEDEQLVVETSEDDPLPFGQRQKTQTTFTIKTISCLTSETTFVTNEPVVAYNVGEDKDNNVRVVFVTAAEETVEG